MDNRYGQLRGMKDRRKDGMNQKEGKERVRE